MSSKKQEIEKPALVCFIEEALSRRGKTYYHVCSVDPSKKVMTIRVHDIKHIKEEAEEALRQVEAGTHPTQTHPAGSLWLVEE